MQDGHGALRILAQSGLSLAAQTRVAERVIEAVPNSAARFIHGLIRDERARADDEAEQRAADEHDDWDGPEKRAAAARAAQPQPPRPPARIGDERAQLRARGLTDAEIEQRRAAPIKSEFARFIPPEFIQPEADDA